MTEPCEHLRFFAAALYEIRCLLGGFQSDDVPEHIRLAAGLAYILHNDALKVVEQNERFDVEAARKRVQFAEGYIGVPFGDGHRELKPKTP